MWHITEPKTRGISISNQSLGNIFSVSKYHKVTNQGEKKPDWKYHSYFILGENISQNVTHFQHSCLPYVKFLHEMKDRKKSSQNSKAPIKLQGKLELSAIISNHFSRTNSNSTFLHATVIFLFSEYPKASLLKSLT